MGPRVRAAPSPYDLFDAPELASVDALTAVLDIAVAAVVAANPELLDAERLDARGPPSAQAWVMGSIQPGGFSDMAGHTQGVMAVEHTSMPARRKRPMTSMLASACAAVGP